MKNYSLIKIAAMSAVFVTAMAFSCQDHNLPDPDPVVNCKRIDGTPRAFPCEFEIVKVEFLRNNTSQVVRTVFPSDPNVELPINAAKFYGWGSGRSYIFMQYNIRVHVKRIANPSFLPVGGYEVMDYSLTPAYPPYPPLHDDLIGPGGWPPPGSPAANPVAFDMAIGETRTVEKMVTMQFNTEFPPVTLSYGPNIVSVVNNTTTIKLINAPYNYDRLRDVHEARIAINPSLTCEPGELCL